tara:strand:- start:3995 stop:4867 length:873 start_codon:yes stop_codon:yes gene_type:complete
MKEFLIKIIAACLLVNVLSQCLEKKTKVSSDFNNKKLERFKPFTSLGVIPPNTYEDVIKEAFRRMSSGEKIRNIDCSVKMDINSEDSYSLTNYIVNQLKQTINTLPRPTNIGPTIGEDFSVIDLSGFIAQETAVVTFTLFHKRRYFAIQCRAVATRGSDKPGKKPWYIHKIHYAQENPNPTDYKVQPHVRDCKIKGSVLEEPTIPSIEDITYPLQLENIITELQRAVPKDEIVNLPMGVDTRLVKDANLLKAEPANASEDKAAIKGSDTAFTEAATIGDNSFRPSSFLLK